MELVFSSDDFKVGGVSYPNFPILLDRNGDVFVEALSFLIYHCIKRGRVRSENSWITFGRDLYDFFSFTETNELDWKVIQSCTDEVLLAVYRDVSIKQFGVSATTINRRLRLIIKFYQYAYNHTWVTTLPYELETVTVKQPKKFLAHADASGGIISRPDVLLKQPRTKIKLLNTEQIQQLLSAIRNKTLFNMVRLGLLTGLRKEEILTFPLKYVVNSQNSRGRSHIKVSLEPSDMRLKGSEPRDILVPVTLMAALREYAIHDRHKLLKDDSEPSECLFINRYGNAWSLKSEAFNNELKKLGLPFHVHAHMLRHTFATHTLKSLQSKKALNFNPLLVVRNLLGHSSLTTTERYLHFIYELEDDLTTEYQLEIDTMCDGVSLDEEKKLPCHY